MTRRAPDDRRGIALVMVLMVLAVLIVVVLELATESAAERNVARNYQATLQQTQGMQAVTAEALALLKADMAADNVDHPGESWAEERAMVLGEKRTDDAVEIEWRMEDEAGKFNLRILTAGPPEHRARAWRILVRLLDNARDRRSLRRDEVWSAAPDGEDMAAALADVLGLSERDREGPSDFRREDDLVDEEEAALARRNEQLRRERENPPPPDGGDGDEDADGGGERPEREEPVDDPWARHRDGATKAPPQRSLEGLFIAAGLDTRLLPDRRTGRGEDDVEAGLGRVLTLHGGGRINVNTAHPLLVAALLDEEPDDERTERVLDFRAGDLSPEELREPTPPRVPGEPAQPGAAGPPFEARILRSPDQFRRVIGVDKAAFDRWSNLVGTESRHFTVHARVQAGHAVRHGTALIRRDPYQGAAWILVLRPPR